MEMVGLLSVSDSLVADHGYVEEAKDREPNGSGCPQTRMHWPGSGCPTAFQEEGEGALPVVHQRQPVVGEGGGHDTCGRPEGDRVEVDPRIHSVRVCASVCVRACVCAEIHDIDGRK